MLEGKEPEDSSDSESEESDEDCTSDGGGMAMMHYDSVMKNYLRVLMKLTRWNRKNLSVLMRTL